MEFAAVSSTAHRSAQSSRERAIDLVHLSRMTFGDRALEREVLSLFARQAAQLAGKIENAEREAMGALAHTLKGSASGVGAWSVARAATELEERGREGGDLGPAVRHLRGAVDEACALAESLLRSH